MKGRTGLVVGALVVGLVAILVAGVLLKVAFKVLAWGLGALAVAAAVGALAWLVMKARR